jgi:hypothetical protein
MAAMFGALPLAIGMGVGSELRKPLGNCHRWLPDCFADAYALHHTGNLPGSRSTPAASKEAPEGYCRSSSTRLAAVCRAFRRISDWCV